MTNYLQKSHVSAWLLITFLVLVFMQIAIPALAATTVSVLDGQITVTGTFATTIAGERGSISVTDDVVTATATGYNTKNTTTVEVTNNTSTAATITFSYTMANYSANSENKDSGSKTLDLAAGASTTLTITCKKAWSNQTATMTLYDFTYTAAAATSNVTFDYTGGSVSVGGTVVVSGSSVDMSADGEELVATPNSGYTFLGWVNQSTNVLISTDSPYILEPVGDMTVRAAFASSSTKAWFKVGDFLVDDLNLAVTLGPIVIPMYDGTLLAGNYAIPAGVTLLIPYNADNTLCTTKPTITTTNGTTSASAYRMLTMASSAHITVNGAISVGGQQYCSRPIGAVSGKYGVIEMAEGSSITVENGGFLYAWGYIAGVKGSNNTVSEGIVTIKSGGTVYEDFQVVDWRGGSATTEMIDNSYKVFPMSQYYVQNVQVPMTLESGATENTFTSVNVTLVGTQEAPVTFIGTGGMFVLGDNTSVIKDYNEATDRLTLKIVEGSVSLGSVTMTLKISTLGGTKTINSANYVLPLNGNITIIANSGTTLSSNNSVAMLPGSELILEEGSNFNITSGSYYIYDLDEWTYDTTDETITSILNGNTYNNGGYCSEFNYVMMAVPYAHDRLKTRTATDLKDAAIQVDGTITVSDGAYVYTTAGGANVYSTGSGKIEFKGAPNTSGKAYQAIATDSDRTGVSYLEIPITPVKLKNGNGTLAETSSNTTEATYTYCSDCMAWLCEESHDSTIQHATNVELGNSLNMFFAFWGTNDMDWEGYYLTITHTDSMGKELGTKEYSQVTWKSATVNGQTANVVFYDGLAAKQMCDVLTVRLYQIKAEGDVLIDTWSNSIRNYALRMLSQHSDNAYLRTALVDMLNYGAACQEYFAMTDGYEYAYPANEGLSSEQLTYATPDSEELIPEASTNTSANGYWNGSNLITSSNIQFAIAFNNANNIAKIEYTYANHWQDGDNGRNPGSAITKTVDYNGTTPFYLTSLVVADARQEITIAVYDSNGTKLDTWTDSIAAYCARMIASINAQLSAGTLEAAEAAAHIKVFTDFLKFSDSAELYLEVAKLK